MIVSSLPSRASPPSPSSMTITIFLLTQVHNAAAVAVTQGHYEESLNVLESVILETKQLLSRVVVAEPIQAPKVSPLYDDACYHTQSSVFLCPFVLQENPVRTHPGPLLAVVFFNVAVAHHGKAFFCSGEEEQRDYLARARGCYEYAKDLLDEDPDVFDPDEDFLYVYLALCHNIADLERQLRTGQANVWREAMEDSFLTVTPDESSPLYRYFERATNPERMEVHRS